VSKGKVTGNKLWKTCQRVRNVPSCAISLWQYRYINGTIGLNMQWLLRFSCTRSEVCYWDIARCQYVFYDHFFDSRYWPQFRRSHVAVD
jgi:hypothetical protein